MMLRVLLQEFDCWAATQTKDGDGWESWFPRWVELLTAALNEMRHATPHDSETVALIARVWSISEESEDLADAVRKEPGVYAAILPRTRDAADWRGRFQIYALSSFVPSLGASFAMAGLADESTYVVRRSLLALDEISHLDAVKHAARFLDAADVELRNLATQLISGA